MTPAFSLQGQRIMITGAASGIGAAAARICASLGAEVALVDLAGCETVAATIAADGGVASCFSADVADGRRSRRSSPGSAGSTGWSPAPRSARGRTGWIPTGTKASPA